MAMIGASGLPLPQSPSSAGFVYRDDCRSSLTLARHVMFQEDIADAINGVRYVMTEDTCAQSHCLAHLLYASRLPLFVLVVELCATSFSSSTHPPTRYSFRPSRCGRGLGAEMFAEAPATDDATQGAFELRGSDCKVAMKQVADCLAALEPKKTSAQ